MDWTILLTAFSAIGAAAAAAAAAWQAFETRKQVIESKNQDHVARAQFLQARYDDARPILIIKSGMQSIPVHQGSDWSLDWDASAPAIAVYNAGNGAAFNVRSVIYGPEAIAVTDPNGTWQYWVGVKAEEEKEKHWHHWTVDTINQGEEKELQYTRASIFTPKKFSKAKKCIETKDHKQRYTFNAPKLPLESPNVSREQWHICRITITYHDIFHRKHSSIIDLVFWQGWEVVTLLDDISHDLDDLVD